MAEKIKFPLVMSDGAKVKSLDEMREHFVADDMEKLVNYFLDGTLVKWLADRYYEAEVFNLAKLDRSDSALSSQICAILGLSDSTENGISDEEKERLAAVRRYLAQRTDDAAILSNASKTAIDQEGLAYLIDAGEETIYLCGKKFTIPASVGNKMYIGVLSQPEISINAKSADDLAAKNIIFRNVILPTFLAPAKQESLSYAKENPQSERKANGETLEERLRHAAHAAWGESDINKPAERRRNDTPHDSRAVNDERLAANCQSSSQPEKSEGIADIIRGALASDTGKTALNLIFGLLSGQGGNDLGSPTRHSYSTEGQGAKKHRELAERLMKQMDESEKSLDREFAEALRGLSGVGIGKKKDW